MKLCAAQLAPEAGNVERNVLKHRALIDVAISRAANLILFPELSLTGYELTLAKDLATDAHDQRLDVFQTLADAGNLIIGAGLPARSPEGIRITMVLFLPHRERLAYAKQQLHADELPFFVNGDEPLILAEGGHTFAPAICFESLQPNHAEAAARKGADIYLASVAKPQRNVARAYAHYPQVARQHFMTVLMSNSVGRCDDFVSAGQSAIWNNSGTLVAGMDDETEGFVMYDTSVDAGCVVLL